jgi:hypothetical protein
MITKQDLTLSQRSVPTARASKVKSRVLALCVQIEVQ